jgi:hypothetical protein
MDETDLGASAARARTAGGLDEATASRALAGQAVKAHDGPQHGD